MWGDFTTDLRLTLRGLARTKSSSAILVLTVALGIGASTAVFSVVRSVLLQPLPLSDPHELVTIRHRVTAGETSMVLGVPGPDLLDYREGTRSLESMGIVSTLETNLEDGQGAARVTIAWVSPGFLDALGTTAAAGRMLVPTDWTPRSRAQMEDPGFSPPPMPVMLSYGLWRNRFGGAADIVGRSVTINGTSMNVVGVLEEGFRLYAPPDAPIADSPDAVSYLPIPLTEGQRAAGGGIAIGRLVDGATVEQAREELERVTASLIETHSRHAGLSTEVVVGSLLDDVVGDARAFLWILFGSIGLVLLIAVLNVASLLLVRAGERTSEFALKIALGGSRARLVRQLMTESLVVATLGAAVGWGLAWLGVGGLLALAPADLPRVEAVRIDGGVVAFTILVTTVSAIVFGLVPALMTRSAEPGVLLASRGSVGAGRGGRRVRGALVVGEVALSVLLVAGAGLLLRSFSSLTSVDPGYDAEGSVALQVALPFFTYRQLDRRQAFFSELLERSRALPGVTAAGLAPALPLTDPGWSWQATFAPSGEDLDAPDTPRARYRVASDGFLEAIGARLVEGRTFVASDGEAGSELTVVLDRRIAERHWPAGDAVGRTMDVVVAAYIGEGRRTTARVVGVVEPIRYASLRDEGEPSIWMPFAVAAPLDATVVLRGRRDAVEAAGQLRAILQELDPGVPIFALRTLSDDLAESTARNRYALLLLTLFAATALVLAAVGLYGVVSSVMQQRAREIGVRIALGARGHDVGSMILRQGATLSALGVLFGGAATIWLAPLLEGLLYRVAALDPLTLLATGLILAATTLLASWVPAYRATKLDPVDAIRAE